MQNSVILKNAMPLEQWLNRIILADAMEILPKMPENSIDLVLTDPPYFLDKMDDHWEHKKVSASPNKRQVIKNLPPGMKFSNEQGVKMYEWYLKISKEIYRILKPGGFFFSFGSPRLFHRMACAVEDAGFYLRDTFIWVYTQNQPKAMSLHHFVDKLDLDEQNKQKIHEKITNWKTPKIKSCFEPIIVAQKPTEGTLLENFLKYNTSLFNTSIRIGKNMFPANVLLVDGVEEILDKYFLISKPGKEERVNNWHPTVKPLTLCEYLIELSTVEGAVVLDPFVGSGTTAIAAKNTKRKFIGIDINEEYVKIAEHRIKNVI